MPAIDPQEVDAKTKLLPANLAPVAAANLAAQDSSIANVNAAGAKTALPGVGLPGSTPQTDQTNLNVAAAMERGDLGNRFGFGSQEYLQGTERPVTPQFATSTGDIINSAIENRMAAIAQGQDPDHPALYVSPHRSTELQHEFALLGEQRNRNALLAAHQAATSFTQQQHTDTANQVESFFQGLNEINNDPNTPIGSQAHVKAVTALAYQNPLAVQSKAVADTLKTHSAINDAGMTMKQRALDAGLTEDDLASGRFRVKTIEAGGGKQSHVTYERTPDGKTVKLAPIDQQAKTEAVKAFTTKGGLTSDDWKNPTEVVGTNADGKQVENGTHIKFTGPSGKSVVLTNSQFDTLKATWGVPATAKNATPAPSATPAATPKPAVVKQNGVTYTLQPDGSYK